jgi:hypothetical protein
MFNKKPISFASLQEEKNRILGVFTLMAKELETLQTRQTQYKEDLLLRIEDLQKEFNSVDDSLVSTTTTISNIYKITNTKENEVTRKTSSN